MVGGSARHIQSQLLIKHALDKVIAGLFIALTLPIGLLSALALWLEDRGPVFFVQKRLGLDGHIFSMYKFRSMRVNSHVLLNADGSTRVEQHDARVTVVGGVLRRTSLDELPQLLNVLVGDMSIVGPRPDLPEHLSLYTDTDRLKLRMRPGITGLPQIMGRNELPWKERIRLDNQYIDDYSLWLDMRILVSTALVVITGRGVVSKG